MTALTADLGRFLANIQFDQLPADAIALECACTSIVAIACVVPFEMEGEGRRQPTAPSISSWMRRLSSTAYSMGSSLVKGSMKPPMIMPEASSSVSPRLIK